MYASLVAEQEGEVRLVTGAPMSLFDRDTRAAIKKTLRENTLHFQWRGANRQSQSGNCDT